MFNTKKRYFKRKLDGVQKMIWDFEFKKEKSLMIREEVRVEYDGACTRLDIILTKIKSQLKNPTKICEVHNPEKGKEAIHKDKGNCACEYIENHSLIGEIETLYDEKTRLSQLKAEYVEQMAVIDIEIQGSKRTNQYPEGHEGINQTIEKLRELGIMYKQHISKI